MSDEAEKLLDLQKHNTLSVAERKKLFGEMHTDGDREVFDRIVKRSQAMRDVVRDKLDDPRASMGRERGWTSTEAFWDRIEARDLRDLAGTVQLREARLAMRRGENAPIRVSVQEQTAEKPARVFAERLFGDLQNVRPMQEGERERLFDGMKADRDRDEFRFIEARYAQSATPDMDVWGREITPDATGVREFADEFQRRAEARDLRQHAKGVQEREQNRSRTRNRAR